MTQRLFTAFISICLIILLAACTREQPTIIIITATFPPAEVVVDADNTPIPTSMPTSAPPAQTLVLSPIPAQPLSNPTPNATLELPNLPDEHLVQPGESLSAIAARYNLSLDALLAANELENPNILSVGQVIALPEVPQVYTPEFKIIPDSRLVRAPGSQSFDIAAFIAQQPGYIRTATDDVDTSLSNGATFTQTLTSSQIIERVSLEYSVDARLLLALLEFRAGWLSNPAPREDLLSHPFISLEQSEPIDRAGLYKQLAWAANELNRGYYGWKYRGNTVIEFTDGTLAQYNPALNPGTIGLHYLFSLAGQAYDNWLYDVSFNGFYATYAQYFGDPFAGATDPLVPQSIQQPELILPFEPGVTWRFTGGPHGGWGSGSAWASLDFAPDQDRPVSGSFCFVGDSWITAVAPGIIARSGGGVVVLDLDGDGDESTGWTINYLHLEIDESITAGTTVLTGQRLGRPSCAGGFSTATHVHIGRRFNGEWLPADCQACLPGITIPPFLLGGWQTFGLVGQEYQGYLEQDGVRVTAEQGRTTTINLISW